MLPPVTKIPAPKVAPPSLEIPATWITAVGSIPRVDPASVIPAPAVMVDPDAAVVWWVPSGKVMPAASIEIPALA